ncbi:hypothetical protein BDZ91DRAFT_748624 [Kalaharituber pfeilii]|nr:hypothetical protein BDZ91DRAFT_748624 [Kalaharituber pfeilii]
MFNAAEESQKMRLRAQELVENVTHVLKTIEKAAGPRKVRLVAVSKLKPASDILALHNAASTPTSHFGENYFQELTEKSGILPPSINWHFIGTLQSNKCKSLASIPNLWAVESLDSIKKADALEKGRAALLTSNPSVAPLRVFIQVNTSNEESKSGCQPPEVPVLAKHIVKSCPSLILQGLMTIGAIARSKQPDVPNEDFILLRETRDKLAQELGWEKDSLELSMGMSEDYVAAIGEGATTVRVGLSIFGARPPKQDSKVKEEAVAAQS